MSTKDAKSLVIRLSGWLQEEIAAQHRLDELLAEQERAIRAIDTPAIRASGARVQDELRTTTVRERRRKALMSDLGRTWGADPKALTLSSIAARLGADSREGQMLLRQRTDLRSIAAAVTHRGRRIASLARYHAGLLSELMNTLLGVEGTSNRDDGVLVDARA